MGSPPDAAVPLRHDDDDGVQRAPELQLGERRLDEFLS